MAINPVPQFFKELFRSLEQNQITYGVLKHFDRLPERPGRDVDMWVKADHFQKCLKITFKVARNQSWEFLARFPLADHFSAGGYFFLKRNGGNHICELDVLPVFHWKGISYLDESILPQHILVHKKGFKVVAPGIEAAAMIFRGGMMGEIKEADRAKIVECLKQDPTSFLEVLTKPFGKQTAAMIMEAALARKWEFLEQNMSSFRKTLAKRALRHRPLYQMGQWLKYAEGMVKAHLHPSHGFFLALIGPDGVGKSTIARLLMDSEFTKKAFLKRVLSYRRFQIPWLKKIVQIGKELDVATFDIGVNNRGMVAPLPPGKAAIYSLYLALEYFLGHYYIQKLKPNSGLMIFDRYFYDNLVFQDFLRCPQWLLKLLVKIVPRPDATIYLTGNPQIIHARKPEWPIVEIQRQVCAYNQLSGTLPNLGILDASKKPEEITENLISLIIKKLQTRNQAIPRNFTF